MHAVHGALWDHHTMLVPRTDDGAHLVTAPREGSGEEGTVIALSVPDLQAMFDIPAFDVVYLDIEGGKRWSLEGSHELSLCCAGTISN